MSLNMFAFKCKKRGNPKMIAMVDFKAPEDSKEIMQWLKHPNLHGWMERQYRLKDGQGNFNEQNMELELKDFNKLEKDIKNNRLPKTKGFFFGESTGTPEEVEKDLMFIELAIKYIKEGYSIFYRSSW